MYMSWNRISTWKTSARIYRPCIRENKPKKSSFSMSENKLFGLFSRKMGLEIRAQVSHCLWNWLNCSRLVVTGPYSVLAFCVAGRGYAYIRYSGGGGWWWWLKLNGSKKNCGLLYLFLFSETDIRLTKFEVLPILLGIFLKYLYKFSGYAFECNLCAVHTVEYSSTVLALSSVKSTYSCIYRLHNTHTCIMHLSSYKTRIYVFNHTSKPEKKIAVFNYYVEFHPPISSLAA